MKISTRGRYAVRALLELTKWRSQKPLMLSVIAKRQAIPERYLIQILSALRRKGLVHSVRGAQGGFRLAKLAQDITLAEILDATEGPLMLVSCVAPHYRSCLRMEECDMRSVWKKINSKVLDMFENITLAQIASGEIESKSATSMMYHI